MPTPNGAVATAHVTINPKILYFGTPVVLLSIENDDGGANLAPSSSASALGHTFALGLGSDGQSVHNLMARPDMVINLPAAHQWEAVERLAPLTGRHPGTGRPTRPAPQRTGEVHPRPARALSRRCTLARRG